MTKEKMANHRFTLKEGFDDDLISWVNHQESLNVSLKLLIRHFVSQYGIGDMQRMLFSNELSQKTSKMNSIDDSEAFFLPVVSKMDVGRSDKYLASEVVENVVNSESERELYSSSDIYTGDSAAWSDSTLGLTTQFEPDTKVVTADDTVKSQEEYLADHTKNNTLQSLAGMFND